MRTWGLVFITLLVAACGDDDASKNNANAVNAANSSNSANATNNVVDMGDVDAGADMGAPFEMPVSADALLELGPSEVGYRALEFSYMPPGATEARVVPFKVWYPAVADSGASTAEYAVGGIIQVDSGMTLDAPPAQDGEFPVTIYSHGSGGEGLVAYPYGEHMASWGWIVFAPNHVGNTVNDALQMNSAPFLQNALYRVTDISALIDAIEAGVDDEAVDGRADLENIFLFGHSFGAYTTLAVGGADLDTDAMLAGCTVWDDGSCEFIANADVEAAFRAGFGDDRVDAIAPQAPALVPLLADGSITSIEVPTMLQSGRLDQTTTQEEQAAPTWAAMDGADDIWVEMPTGAHYSFITICTDLDESTLAFVRPNAPEDGCGDAFIDTTVAVPTLGGYIHAFARQHVLGEDGWDAIINGEALNDGFQVTTK